MPAPGPTVFPGAARGSRLPVLTGSAPHPPPRFPRRRPAGQGGAQPAACLQPPSGPSPAAPRRPQVYVNAVWHGWAIPMFLFLAILRLSLNYLIAR